MARRINRSPAVLRNYSLCQAASLPCPSPSEYSGFSAPCCWASARSGVAGITWAYLIEPNLLFVRKVDYRVPQWNGRGKPVKVVIAGDLHLMPTAFDEVRALRYVRRIMQLQPDLILLVGDYARGRQQKRQHEPRRGRPAAAGAAAPAASSPSRGTMTSPSTGTTGARN